MPRPIPALPAVLLVLLIPFWVAPANSGDWTIVGPRALGMGGANVAVANDATADYWNPAAFGFFKDAEGGDYGKRTWSMVINAGAAAQIHDNLGTEINNITQDHFSDIQSAINSNTPLTGAQVSDFLQLVNELKTFNSDPDRAATVMADGAVRIQVGHFGIAWYRSYDISAVGNLDLVNISPSGSANLISGFGSSNTTFGNTSCGGTVLSASQINSLSAAIAGLPGWSSNAGNFVNAANCALYSAQQSGTSLPSNSAIIADLTTTAQLASLAQSGGSIANNTSSLIFRGIMVDEVPVTYGRALTEDLAVGGNLKFMRGQAYQASVPVFQNFGDALNKARDQYKQSENVGLDLGVLYRFGDKLRAGIVGRNLNAPSFTMPALNNGPDDSIRELPQVRTGLAYKPFSFLTLAGDLDLTRNGSTIPGGDYKYQNVAGGLEINIFRFLQLRGGIYKNMAQSDIGPVYTAGLGLNFWLLNLDIGAAMASKNSQIDSNSVPNEARAEFALSMLF